VYGESARARFFFPPFSCPLGKVLVQSWKCLGFSFTASCGHEIIPAFCGTFLMLLLLSRCSLSDLSFDFPVNCWF
jgi:hypothetical protein